MVRIIVLLISCCFLNVAYAKTVTSKNSEVHSKSDCEDNADILAYLNRVSAICGFEASKKHLKYFGEVNKACVKQHGNKLVFNASMMGIHATNAELEETGKTATCTRAFTEYRDLFE